MRWLVLFLLLNLSSCVPLAHAQLATVACGDVSSAQRIANRSTLENEFATKRVVVLPDCVVHVSGTIVLNGVTDLRVEGQGSAVYTTGTPQPRIVSYDPSMPVIKITGHSVRQVWTNLQLSFSSNASTGTPALLIEDSASLRFEHFMIFSTTVYDGVHFTATSGGAPCGDSGPNDVCIVTFESPQMYGQRGSGFVITGHADFGKLPVIYAVGHPIIAGGLGVSGSAAYRVNDRGVAVVQGGYMYLSDYMMYCDTGSLCWADGVHMEPEHHGIYGIGPDTHIRVRNCSFQNASTELYAVSIAGSGSSGMITGNDFGTLIADGVFVDAAEVMVNGNKFKGANTLTAIVVGGSGGGSSVTNNAKFGGIN